MAFGYKVESPGRPGIIARQHPVWQGGKYFFPTRVSGHSNSAIPRLGTRLPGLGRVRPPRGDPSCLAAPHNTAVSPVGVRKAVSSSGVNKSEELQQFRRRNRTPTCGTGCRKIGLGLTSGGVAGRQWQAAAMRRRSAGAGSGSRWGASFS